VGGLKGERDRGRDREREGGRGGGGGEKLLETRSVIVVDIIPRTPALQCDINLLGTIHLDMCSSTSMFTLHSCSLPS